MLQITIDAKEQWNEITEEFVTLGKSQTLILEHSLVSISKWESKWKKPFMSKEPKTLEETIDYIKCMTITQNVSPEVYRNISKDTIKEVNEYIDDPMTATWFSKNQLKGSSGETVTNELVYYWMIALNIPMKCEKWHFNRLMTLIKVCNEKNKPPKHMAKKDIYKQNAMLNEARRKKLNSRG